MTDKYKWCVYRFISFQLLAILIFSGLQTQAQNAVSIQQDSNVIQLADPTIFHHKGIYYLYGTVEGATGNGFLVYNSADLKSWNLAAPNDGYALRKENSFGTAGFWAPQVFLHQGKFYLAYVANEQIAIAMSDNPLGPFVQTEKKSLEAPVKQIDPFVFVDDDGKKYLYHVRLIQGNKIFVAEMNDDFLSIKSETLRECITATQPWENTNNARWPVTEGPSILKHKGIYYLFYTANDFRNPDYAVGYATSDHPLGPWTKYQGNPILTKGTIGKNGPGHGDFFKGKKGLYYVFHTHQSELKVAPRKTALVKTRFEKSKMGGTGLVIDNKSFHFLNRSSHSVNLK